MKHYLIILFMLPYAVFAKETLKYCPDGVSACLDGQTCCLLSTESYDCCPLPNAVCCSDHLHCCPQGYRCDIRYLTCNRGTKKLPMLSSASSQTTKEIKPVSIGNATPVSRTLCPGGHSYCPDQSTCCSLGSIQYACCPLSHAICCPDKKHCCPPGYSCNMKTRTCNKGLHSVTFMAKVSAQLNKRMISPTVAKVKNAVCPYQESQCPDGNTCCMLASGQYDCCPLPNAVCCSDHVHCCPSGYTCDVSSRMCNQGLHSAPMDVKLFAQLKKDKFENVVCPDGQSECPDGNTCCRLSSGQYGCCPLPKAVCCSDGVHCCPNGYMCDISSGTCNKGLHSVPVAVKLSAQLKKDKVENVVCPDGQSECPDGNTCCKLASGQYGCCPLPKAVCCSDHIHCCPNGYTCDVSSGTCSKGLHSVPMVIKPSAQLKNDKVDNVICPDGVSECPDRNTCCKLPSGRYGCCPLPKAVCCSDHIHCCPNGYTCDISSGTCNKGLHSVPMAVKLSAQLKKDKIKNVFCPDGQSECPDGNTCCKLASGQYGCCPLPKAVCCSDHIHCCPNGYTCDVSSGTCNKGLHSVPMVIKLSAQLKSDKVETVICPDGESECPDGNTCCKLASGQYGCCPLPKAVCCSDGVHCCPNGYTCDVSGTCSKGLHLVPMVVKLSAKLRQDSVKTVVCPGGQSECPDGNTCCKLASGQYGCCPLPKAVCCSDGVHCCPNGYTCDISSGTCNKGLHSVPMAVKLSAQLKKDKVENVVCPDGQSECPDGNTCCKLASGQYGCCPLPKAVCCSDHIHCCPNGYTCDVSSGMCSKGLKSVPMVIKPSAQLKNDKVDNVICPDGVSECPDRNTCCKLPSGQYGCCPLPKAVCCSDHIHCCPNGYTCDISSGTCNKGLHSVPMAVKLSAQLKKDKIKNVFCPDGQSECPDGNTCCKLASGQYGCCPLPKAVCCSDHIHCCPNGYTCDVSSGTCNKGLHSVPMVIKLSAQLKSDKVENVICPDGESECPDGNTCCKLASGQYGCCPLPKAVCCSDGVHCCPNGYTCDVSGTCSKGLHLVPMVVKLSAKLRQDSVKTVVCPGGQSECPDGNTCCKLASGQYGCCPLPKAVCCSDGVHCCPNGYTCDISSGTCNKGLHSVPMAVKLSAQLKKDKVENVVCPDGQSECPDGNTCCKLASGQYGCCPLPKAVCCSDHIHCCPNGYTCDIPSGTCSKGLKSVPMVIKPSAQLKNDKVDNVICPDGVSECPDRNTCCKLPSGQYGCCPLPKAVCCSDHIHCCPNGYTCDISSGTCSKGLHSVPMAVKLSAQQKKDKIKNVVCPDGQSECPDGNTCCKLASGQYGCCPLPKAVCCSDHIHCCPNGYTCDVSSGTCNKGLHSVPIFIKLSAQLKNDKVENVICPDGESECPDGNTCCKLYSGQYGCCPLPKAVCCFDGVHCCPNGYTCDISSGTCNKGLHSVPMAVKLSAQLKKDKVENVVCPDGQSECPDGNTCCKLASGQYGCCPLPKAVCCSDGVHCCPNGYTCDISSGTCNKGLHSVPMAVKLSAQLKKGKVENVVCPDGESKCPDGNTCCKLASGRYGCCPLPKAVCCSDHIHCCPNGYACDVSSGTCNKGLHSVPMAVKLSAQLKKDKVENVVCPDGESECPNGNTCCKLASGQYGCCPLPKAVRCSDGVHCCPNGYTCDVSGTCSKGLHLVPMVVKLSAKLRQDSVKTVVCPGGESECPDGNSCCKLNSGQYGCCPLTKAVCCSDGVHCCPNGYTCDVPTAMCNKGFHSAPMSVKVPAQSVKERVSSAKTQEVSSVTSHACPDGHTECPDDCTCCPTSSGSYGCCPLASATCCSDGIHCCPEGYTCDVKGQQCVQRIRTIALVIISMSMENGRGSNNVKSPGRSSDSTNNQSLVYCGRGEETCPDDYTCCKIPGGWGCCPLPKAVCCSDEEHCCPHDTTCNLKTNTCIPHNEGKETPLYKKKPAMLVTPQVQLTNTNIVCPDGESQCAKGETCCELSTGMYGCCPLQNAVCCKDHLHCCPHGTSCDLEEGRCDSSDGAEMKVVGPKQANYLIFLPKGQLRNGLCPYEKTSCPSGYTCCKLATGKYGCCPYEKATCCSDGIHCCPHGKTCDLIHLRCVGRHEYYPLLAKAPATKVGKFAICPNHLHHCPEGMTCCLAGKDTYGCCPLPEAVCCNDRKHCCPQGSKCDSETGQCIGNNLKLPMLKKVPAMRRDTIVVCPDQIHGCPSGMTCCLISKDTYGCCPLPKAVCCADYSHCCPHGTKCNIASKKCVTQKAVYPIVSKVFAQLLDIKEGQVICPNKKQACPVGSTCCLVSDDQYECCPYPKATCCTDKIHCCPQGFRCGAEGKKFFIYFDWRHKHSEDNISSKHSLCYILQLFLKLSRLSSDR